MADVMIAVMPVPRARGADGRRRGCVRRGGPPRPRLHGLRPRRPVPAVGAETLPWTSAPDFDEHDLAATFPALRGRKGPRQMLANVEHVFVRTAAAQSDDLVQAFHERPRDVIVARTPPASPGRARA